MVTGGLGKTCKDSEGKIVQNSGTRYHTRFVDTPKTISVTKSIDSPLKIELVRREGKVVIERVF